MFVGRLTDAAQTKGLSEKQLETLLTRVGTNTAEAMRSSLKPENPDHPEVSVFNPLGQRDHPKPTLRVKTWFCGIEEKAERLTPEEIVAYNAITTDRTARRDWKARIINKGQPNEELFVSIPCETVDQRMGLPNLELILIELNGGPSTEDLSGLISQIRRLEQELVEAKAVRGTAYQLQEELLK